MQSPVSTAQCCSAKQADRCADEEAFIAGNDILIQPLAYRAFDTFGVLKQQCNIAAGAVET